MFKKSIPSGSIGNEWQTFLLKATDPGTLDAVDTWPSEYEEKGKLITTRFTTRILDGPDADGKYAADGPEEFVALALNAAGVAESAAQANVVAELEAQGASGVTVVDTFRAPNYNCRFSEQGVEAGKPWALDDLQGLDGIFYVGGSVTFEAMEPILASVVDDGGVGSMVVTHKRAADEKRRRWLLSLAVAVATAVIVALLAIVIGYGTHVQHKREKAELQARVDGNVELGAAAPQVA